MNKKLIWVIVIIILLVIGYFVYASLKSGNNDLSGELGSLKATCTDTDGGKNYTSQGTVSKGTSSNTDVCTSATILQEFYCYGSSIKSTSYSCTSISRLIPFECKNGACVRVCTPIICQSSGISCGIWEDECGGEDINCGACANGYSCYGGKCAVDTDHTNCTDSDGGLNYYLRGYVNVMNDWDWCRNTQNGSLLSEKYCINATTGGTQSFFCPGNCTSGACINQTG